MVGPVLVINDDDVGTARGNEDEVWMRNNEPVAAGGSHFVRHKGNGTIEAANRLNDHELKAKDCRRDWQGATIGSAGRENSGYLSGQSASVGGGQERGTDLADAGRLVEEVERR